MGAGLSQQALSSLAVFSACRVRSHPPPLLPANVSTGPSDAFLLLHPHKPQSVPRSCLGPWIANGAGHPSSAIAWGHAGQGRQGYPGEGLPNLTSTVLRAPAFHWETATPQNKDLMAWNRGGVNGPIIDRGKCYSE